MKFEEDLKEQLESLKDKPVDITTLKGKPNFGDREWKDGDIPLYALFIENLNLEKGTGTGTGTYDIHMKSFAPRHTEEIWLNYAIIKRSKFPTLTPLPKSCQSCGAPIFTALDVELIREDPSENSGGDVEYRTCFVCKDCYQKLDPDMWISYDCWNSLNPNVPYELLPFHFGFSHPVFKSLGK